MASATEGKVSKQKLPKRAEIKFINFFLRFCFFCVLFFFLSGGTCDRFFFFLSRKKKKNRRLLAKVPEKKKFVFCIQLFTESSALYFIIFFFFGPPEFTHLLVHKTFNFFHIKIFCVFLEIKASGLVCTFAPVSLKRRRPINLAFSETEEAN